MFYSLGTAVLPPDHHIQTKFYEAIQAGRHTLGRTTGRTNSGKTDDDDGTDEGADGRTEDDDGDDGT